MKKWICNKCGFETTVKPKNHNSICENCSRGRFKEYTLCKCGTWFYGGNSKRQFCSKECAYKFRREGGKKGKHYPNAQRARIAICPVCHKEFRAVKEYKGRKSVYCSKECWSHRGRKKKLLNRSPEFKKWKHAVFVRDNNTCQMCGSTKNLEAHHIKEKINYPELQYDVNNGICLCHDCHRKTENYGYKARNKHKEKEIKT